MIKFFSYKKQAAVIGSAIAAIVLFSCEKKNGDDRRPLPDVVSFKRDIQPIFKNFCTGSGCHSGPAPAAYLDLSPEVAYDNLINAPEVDSTSAENSVLYQEVASGNMPKSGKMSYYNVRLIKKWIDQRAKNN